MRDEAISAKWIDVRGARLLRSARNDSGYQPHKGSLSKPVYMPAT
jgi:hypothetical protein